MPGIRDLTQAVWRLTMEQTKICPFMSSEDKKVNCLREECQLWFVESEGIESSLNPANCALAHLPLLVSEISNHTRLIRGSMVESIAI
jgi:streptogramin lyase